jgi:4-amino-4-deoxy-L-arabinose transferase
MVPTLNGNPHWTKPPFAYWMISAGMAVVGENAWGARMGGALASAIVAGCLALVGDQLWNRKTGTLAAIIWTTGLLPAAGTFTVSTDIYLAAAETIALCAFLLGWRLQKTNWFILMWGAFGIAFLTKGPPGLLPLAPILLFAYRLRLLRHLFIQAGPLIFIGIGFSWYAWAVLEHPGLIQYFIGVEVLDRVASNNVHNYQWYRAFTLYLPVLIFALGPWGIMALWKGIRTSSFANPRTLLKISPETFLVAAIGIPLVIFCVVKSKLPLYILPLAAPLALLTANFLSTKLQKETITWVAMLSLLFLWSIKIGSGQLHHKNDMQQLSEMVQPVLDEVDLETPLLAFRQTKLFGLQFYLKQPLVRVTDYDQRSDYPVEVYPIQEYLKSAEDPHLIVCRNGHLDGLRDDLKQAGWQAESIRDDKHWTLLELKKISPSLAHFKP